MTEEPNGRLHLPSLSIQGFRGVRELDLPRLGRVTLIVGRNGAGKTTVLEAVRAYASRGWERVLSALLSSHDEFVSVTDEGEGVMFAPDPAVLFHGRDVAPNSRIEIGSKDTAVGGRLKIETVIPSMEQASLLEKLFLRMGRDVPQLIMQVSFANRKRTIPWFFSRYTNFRSPRDIQPYRRFFEDREELSPELNNRALGPGLPNNDEVSDLGDEIVLTDDENRVVQALRGRWRPIRACTACAPTEPTGTGPSCGAPASPRPASKRSSALRIRIRPAAHPPPQARPGRGPPVRHRRRPPAHAGDPHPPACGRPPRRSGRPPPDPRRAATRHRRPPARRRAHPACAQGDTARSPRTAVHNAPGICHAPGGT